MEISGSFAGFSILVAARPLARWANVQVSTRFLPFHSPFLSYSFWFCSFLILLSFYFPYSQFFLYVLAALVRGAATGIRCNPWASRGTSQVTARLPFITGLVIKPGVPCLPGVGGAAVVFARRLLVL